MTTLRSAAVRQPSGSTTSNTPPTPDLKARAELLASLDVDLAPPIEQAWLWAAPETRPLRMAPAWDPASPGLESVLNDAGDDILSAPVEDLGMEDAPSVESALENQGGVLGPSDQTASGSPQRWRARMEQAVDAWVRQPLVWRVRDGAAQAVLLGRIRLTWSVQNPSVRVEQRDAVMGWAPATLDALRTFLTQMTLAQLRQDGPVLRFARGEPPRNPLLDQERSPLIDAVEQIARHAQRHRPRLQGWSRDGAGRTSVSWCPWPVMRSLSPNDIAELLVRVRRGFSACARALTRLDPFWRTVTRSLWRAQVLGESQVNGESGPFAPLVKPEDPPAPGWGPAFGAALPKVMDPWSVLETLGQSWNAWKAAAAEHPRADLLLPGAVALRIPPSQHTWRDDLWSALTGAPRGTWKALREAPRATVATLLRQPYGVHALALITALAQPGHPLPAAVLRQVPAAWWAQAQTQVQAMGQVPAAFKLWPVRRVRAFLEAVNKQVWVEQRQTMSAWLDNALVVVSWALQEEQTPFDDPSWTWATLEQRWMDRRQRGAQWPLPLRKGQHLGVTFSAIGSEPEWRLLGTALRNCLKDERSRGYQEQVQDREGVLVRLHGHGHSAAFLNHDENDHAWCIVEHRSAFNMTPPEAHQRVIRDLVALLTATVDPQGFRPVRNREATMRGWTPEQRTRRAPLLDRLNPAWGTLDVRPSWRHPLRRMGAWLNDDRWWHRQKRQRFSWLMRAMLLLFAAFVGDLAVDTVDTPSDLVALERGLVVLGGVLLLWGLHKGWKRHSRALFGFVHLLKAAR